MSVSDKIGAFINAKRKRSASSSDEETETKPVSAFWGLGSMGAKKPRPVQTEHDENEVADAKRFITFSKKILSSNWTQKINVPSPHSFIKQCETFWSDGVARDIVVVDLENVPPQLRGNYPSLAYTNKQGRLVTKQAFYRSSGTNSSMSGTWLPFDGISHSGNDQTHFEKDNFVSRFGGFDKFGDEGFYKLGLVSQILGGGVWNKDVAQLVRDNIDRVENILETKTDPLDANYRVHNLGFVLEDVGDPWYDTSAQESREGEVYRPPNVFKDHNDNPQSPGFRLSAGIAVAPMLLDMSQVNYKREAATRINKCIGTANSWLIDMGKLGGGYPTTEQVKAAVRSLST